MISSTNAFDKKGSTTIEASIIMPVIILSIICLIFMSLFLYQKANLQALADRSAFKGAASWDNSCKDIETGKGKKSGMDEDGLYWRLLDADKDVKLSRLREYIELRMNRYNLLKPVGINIEVSVSEHIVYKKLVVNLESIYKLPMGKVLGMFGLEDSCVVSAHSEAVINDQAEFIRNMDFASDIEKGLEEKYPEIKNLREKSKNITDSIREQIEKFF